MDSQTQEAQEKYKRMMFEKGDEQTVNACLVALIMPVEWIFGRSGTVHLDREPQQLRGDDGELLYKACVDGVIAGTNSVTKSFIEVKRDLRGKDKGVRMQEGAQMAAFIFQDEQDLDNKVDDPFITIAIYDKHYVDYLKGRASKKYNGFMKMKEYGPFDLQKLKDLDRFLTCFAILVENKNL
ncbi:hypothetical protein MMC28_006644 [Mycoblastus sanguinarius]|nr:hypothetical protein [Mycoblastus sanguinarius]